MGIRSENDAGRERRDECAIRIAATGDIHLGREGDQERWAAAFAGLRDRVERDLVAGTVQVAQAMVAVLDAERDVRLRLGELRGNLRAFSLAFRRSVLLRNEIVHGGHETQELGEAPLFGHRESVNLNAARSA